MNKTETRARIRAENERKSQKNIGTHNGPILFDMISLKHSQNEVSIMNNLKVIRTKDLLEQLNISRISLWRWSKEGKFPQPLKVNGRAFGYRVQDVENWLDEQKK